MQKAIEARKPVSVFSSTGRRFKFTPVENGRYYAFEEGKNSEGDYLEVDDINKLEKFLLGCKPAAIKSSPVT